MASPAMRWPATAGRLTWSKTALASVGLLLHAAAAEAEEYAAARRGGEQPGLDGGGQARQRDGAHPRPVRAVGRVVAGDRVAGTGEPQPARARRGDGAGQPGVSPV